MKTCACISLSGGQGKSSVVFFLSLYLSRQGKRVLVVDCDPQADVTFYLGHEVKLSEPTLLEVLNGQIQPEDGIYETGHPDLFLCPADRNLSKIVPYLINTGTAASVLKRRLKGVQDAFDYALLDVQPSISQISLTAAGASEFVLIPCEALVKGVNSLVSTLEFLHQQQELEAFTGRILGVVPFRVQGATKPLQRLVYKAYGSQASLIK
jgi:chromosome partitioning protein